MIPHIHLAGSIGALWPPKNRPTYFVCYRVCKIEVNQFFFEFDGLFVVGYMVGWTLATSDKQGPAVAGTRALQRLATVIAALFSSGVWRIMLKL